MTALAPPPPPPNPAMAALAMQASAAGGMGGWWRAIVTVARRDFVAVVATPAFLLFLAAPLFMITIGLISGAGGRSLAESQLDRERLLAIATPDDAKFLAQADARLRRATSRPPPLVIHTVSPEAADAIAAHAVGALAHASVGIARPRGAGDAGGAGVAGDAGRPDTLAIWTGTLDRAIIHERAKGSASGDWLALVGDDARRARALARTGDGAAIVAAPPPRRVAYRTGSDLGPMRGLLGYVAVFVLFMLTLLLASQAIGMLAEEKSNKVIEILAAAVPLETVFLGKLVGLIAVAILYVATWGVVLTIGGAVLGIWGVGLEGVGAGAGAQVATGVAAGTAAGSVPGLPGGIDGAAIAAGLSAIAPAIGWPMFLGLGAIYFILSFLIFGGLFLAIGSLAASARDIQMLSLPVIMVEMAMFLLASAGSADPTSRLATIAAIVPLSSPYAMAARGAGDAALWPHALAIGWQLMWVAIVIALGVRLFRIGVLGNGWPVRLPTWWRTGRRR